MMQSMVRLRCDTPMCNTVSETFDGRLYNLQEIHRLLHNQRGWSRRYDPPRDVCPKCSRRRAGKELEIWGSANPFSGNLPPSQNGESKAKTVAGLCNTLQPTSILSNRPKTERPRKAKE